MAKPQPVFATYRTDELREAFLLAGACFVAKVGFGLALPLQAALFPASAVVLAGLYFFGMRLWPAAFLGLLTANFMLGLPLALALTLPIAQVLQGALGAYLLRYVDVDPLFRRYRDAFYTVGVSLLIAGIAPLLFLVVPGTGVAASWPYTYLASAFGFIVLTPFLLRWIAKPGFRRPPIEVIEIGVIFLFLVVTAGLRFVFDVMTLLSIPVGYFILIPLFWIAIRLRPRFMTLATVLLSAFTIYDALGRSTPETLLPILFGAELALIVLAIAFYTVTSLEEDVRVSKNVMRSQLGMLENAVSRISSESQAKNDFIAILAHELRNPLAPVVSSIELMKMRTARDADEAETLEIMDTSMATVRRLLDDLLDISRISEGKVTLDREPIEVGKVLRRAVVTTAHHYKERHQTLSWSGSRETFYVDGDAVRLEQVFSNLLTNASKYSDSGAEVTLDLREDDGFVEVRVIDEGFGIPKESLATIFKPFHQLERGVRSKKGLGIGLALVHSFVEMHDGSIAVHSDGEDRGTTFTVRLPLSAHAPAPETQAPRAEKQRTRRTLPKKRQSGPSILVVDDNDAAAAGIGRLLELRGCAVSYAYEGRRAIDDARDTVFDVIILDIGLADMTGYDVAGMLRAEGYGGLLVALSGFSTEDARTRAVAAGFDHFLVKPAGYADLRQVIPGLK